MSNSFYALVLAGGSGTRFWPLSRKVRPKQLLCLFNENTLLEETIFRLSGVIPAENILILTNQEQEDAVQKCSSVDVPAAGFALRPLVPGWLGSRYSPPGLPRIAGKSSLQVMYFR